MTKKIVALILASLLISSPISAHSFFSRENLEHASLKNPLVWTFAATAVCAVKTGLEFHALKPAEGTAGVDRWGTRTIILGLVTAGTFGLAKLTRAKQKSSAPSH